jgi:hypothetical protein
MAGGVIESLPMQSTMAAMYDHFQDKSLKVQVEVMAIDYNFLKTMGIQSVEGRDFLRLLAVILKGLSSLIKRLSDSWK